MRQSLQDGTPPICRRHFQQLEVCRVVQCLQDVLAGEMLGRDAVFEGCSEEDTPQLLLHGRVAPQLSGRTADADELDTPEGHRLARSVSDLEQDHPRSVHIDLMKLEIDLGLEKPRQPGLDELVSLLCGSRNEVRPHQFVGAVPHPPQDVAA